MDKYRMIDEKITSGYKYMDSDESQKACDIFLDAWEDIKTVMAEDKIRDLVELGDRYEWTEFLFNYVQDLDMELFSMGTHNEQYLKQRIKYCEELLPLIGVQDDLIVENTRRGIAETQFALGNGEECDRLFSEWLATDPAWGWGYIGWSACYQFGTRQIPPDYVKAEGIIREGLNQNNLRDRADVLDRVIELYTAWGNKPKAEELKQELALLIKPIGRGARVNPPVTVVKIGRNDPCPCGSGRKYKKCCGK